MGLRFASYEIQALQHLLKYVGPLYGLTAQFREVSREAMEVFTAVETDFMCFSSLTRLDEQAAVVLGKLRVLDLTRADIRNAVKDAASAKGLYEGAWASDYE